MNNNERLTLKKDILYDECISKGICANAPSLTFLHETLIYYLQDLSYYLLKLKELGITNEKIKENVIEIISSIIIDVDYSQEYFLKILQQLYNNFLQAKELYSSVCQRNHLESFFIKSNLRDPKKLTIANAIRLGQSIFNQKYNKSTDEQKNLFGIITSIIKSLCVHLVELQELNVDVEEGYVLFLTLLSEKNLFNTPEENLYETINKIAEFDHTLLMKLHETREKRYGEITPTEISTTTRPNKAILVSGTNLKELEMVLEATKDKNIDVYTAGHMLMAHSFPKFKEYHHLVGHWGKNTDTLLLDFAEFPGVIFITKHSLQKVENLYRSRIYTTDVIAPKGVMTIKNNDFEPLIKSALDSKGFTKSIEKPPLRVSLNEKVALEKIKVVAEKIEKDEIKHFFTIGVTNHTKMQKDYFEKFLTLLNKDCFVLSFSYTNNKDNVLFVESDYGFPLLYKTFNLLSEKKPLTEINPIILFTRCEVHTISNVVYIKSIGLNKIYFSECSPSLINPSIISSMQKMFNLKTYTNPESDLKNMLAD